MNLSQVDCNYRHQKMGKLYHCQQTDIKKQGHCASVQDKEET